MKRFFYATLLTGIALIAGCNNSESEGKTSEEPEGQLILATTTSTYDSGLLDELIPVYEEETGVDVKIISVGSGQALAMGKNGEADALLVHAPEAEEELEDEGTVLNRHRVMHNDFVVLGPSDDPAGIMGRPVTEAFDQIENQNIPFFSRGDDSGTHMKELSIWEEAGASTDYPSYQESGQGMGDTLRIAAEKDGYILTDRGTFLFLQDTLDPLTILVEGDESLKNIYHVMQVNPELSDQINESAAEAFVTFMTSGEAQEMIKSYGEDEWGQPLFFPHLID